MIYPSTSLGVQRGVLPEQSYGSLNHDIERRMYTAYTTIPFDYLLLNL